MAEQSNTDQTTTEQTATSESPATAADTQEQAAPEVEKNLLDEKQESAPEEKKPEPAAAAEPEQTKEPEQKVEPKQEETAEEKPPAITGPADYQLPEGVPVEFANQAFELGYSQKQLEGTLSTFAGIMDKNRIADMEKIREEGKAFIDSWGDSKKENVNLAKRALETFDIEGQTKEMLLQSGYINHPNVLSFLRSVGEVLKEGGYLNSSVMSKRTRKSKAEKMYPSMVKKKK